MRRSMRFGRGARHGRHSRRRWLHSCGRSRRTRPLPRRDVTHDLARYHRQILLAGFGEAGQRKLARATTAVLGCGALGTAIADTLARAGVGRLILIDRDFVKLTNLQRQMLYDEQDVRDTLPKADATKARLE